MARKLIAVTAAISALFAGCGKADVAIVKPPVVPIYACHGSRVLTEHPGTDDEARCLDAGRLVGMPLNDAERLAGAHGFTVRRAAPLGPGEALTMDLIPSRIDVECDEASEDAIVVRLMYRG